MADLEAKQREKQLMAAVEYAKHNRGADSVEMIILALRNMLDNADSWMMAIQETKVDPATGKTSAAPLVGTLEGLGNAVLCATSRSAVKVEGVGFLPAPINVVIHMVAEKPDLMGAMVNSETDSAFVLDKRMARAVLETEIGELEDGEEES